ncbi:MAG: hypothetical protein J6S92_03935, partial [Oscillospiraceae bacterium]|nr:hypothetical protein [Oscillospiraceae bacterium]
MQSMLYRQFLLRHLTTRRPPSFPDRQKPKKQLFAPGFDWERYGSATISVGQPQPNTADGYRGVCGTLSEPEIDFYLIWDWDGTRPKPAEKPVGTMSAEQCEYEIYRCEAGKSLLHPENKH